MLTQKKVSCRTGGLKSYTYFIIFPLDKGQLEAKFCGVNGEDPRSGLPVKAVHGAARHSSHIDRQLQSADDAMVTIGQGILWH